jgi:hypothetical protein
MDFVDHCAPVARGRSRSTAASASAPTAVLAETATVHLYQDVARSRAFGRRRNEVAASTHATK